MISVTSLSPSPSPASASVKGNGRKESALSRISALCLSPGAPPSTHSEERGDEEEEGSAFPEENINNEANAAARYTEFLEGMDLAFTIVR